jgi:chromosome condensin MukBEF MukE localization factor
MYQSTVLRMAVSHALFFTVYSGLRTGIYTSRKKVEKRVDFSRDWQDSLNDFLCGFVSGLCFRGVSVAYGSSTSVPLTPSTVLMTGLKMGVACSVLESIDDIVKTHHSKIV